MTLRGELEHHVPAIVLVVGSPYQTCQLATFAELYYGVVSQAHHLGDVGDGDEGVVWSAGDLQHKLVLLRLEAGCGGGLLAELQEPANLRSKFGQQLNLVAIGFSGRGLHSRSIVTRYSSQRKSWRQSRNTRVSPLRRVRDFGRDDAFWGLESEGA